MIFIRIAQTITVFLIVALAITGVVYTVNYVGGVP